MSCIGWEAHQWTLGIEEGRVALFSPSCGAMCGLWVTGPNGEPYFMGIGDYEEVMSMPDVPVRVAMATDCPAYPVDENNVPTGPAKPTRGYEAGSHYISHGTRCDCNWWPVVTLTP